MTIEQEERLVERAQGGDGEAFGIIYDAYRGVLYASVIYPRLRDPQSCEEVLQETFLLALKKLDSFKWQGKSIVFWLRMIAANKVHERLSGDKRSGTVDGDVIEYQHDNTWQPEGIAVEREATLELRGRIHEALGMMNDRYRSAIEMRLAMRMSREECAAALEVSVETFDVLFFRACKSFREKYIKKYGEFAGFPS